MGAVHPMHRAFLMTVYGAGLRLNEACHLKIRTPRPGAEALFQAANQTLLEFGRNELKAQIGLTAVLHTWGQTLIDHYHLHCIATGGGLALEGSGWIRSPGHYLFAVRALSKVFGGKFRAGLESHYRKGALAFHGELAALGSEEAFAQLMGELRTQKWVVYAKRPFAGPEQALRYLSRC